MNTYPSGTKIILDAPGRGQIPATICPVCGQLFAEDWNPDAETETSNHYGTHVEQTHPDQVTDLTAGSV